MSKRSRTEFENNDTHKNNDNITIHKIIKKSRYAKDKNVSKSDNIWNPFYNMQIDNTKTDSEQKYWISGTQVKNYLLKDPLLDWLDCHYLNLGFNTKIVNRIPEKYNKINRFKKIKNNDEYLESLFSNGRKFEDKVVQKIYDRFPDDCITIAKNGREDCNDIYFQKTINAINNGIPIIFQAVLINKKNFTKGVADIIVRSDYINKLVSVPAIDNDQETLSAPYLDKDYHYLIIDIKWTDMTLCTSKKNKNCIRNDGLFPAYKGQLAIYNSILGTIQGYTSHNCFIMTKSVTIDDNKYFNCFDVLGKIDYSELDLKYIDETINAINWVRSVRINGHNWSPINPQIIELYPNASNTHDTTWADVKKELININHEITRLWKVGVKNRNIAISKGINKYSDTKLNSEILELGTGQTALIVNKILEVNNKSKSLLLPKFIKYNPYDWKTKSPIDFYVDFETVSGYLKTLDDDEIRLKNSKIESSILFMIGVGHVENDKWIYKCFNMTELTFNEEEKVIDDFIKYLGCIVKKLDPENKHLPKLFHWSPAEPSVFKTVVKRNNFKLGNFEYNYAWVDLCNIFMKIPIVVKGAFNFKLKEVANAFHTNKMTNTKWADGGLSSGIAAMLEGIKYYERVADESLDDNDRKIFKSIIEYNEVDCKVMWEIVEYLRSKH
jgi:hypothetical protein